MKLEKVLHSDFEGSSIGKSRMLNKTHVKEKNKSFPNKDTVPAKGNPPRMSLIPKLRSNNNISNSINEIKGVEQKIGKPVKPSKLATMSLNITNELSGDCEKPVKSKNFKLNDEPSGKTEKNQESHCQSPSQKMYVRQQKPLDPARRLISDPQMFNKGTSENSVLINVENSVRQISEIWLKTSAALSNAVKSLKNNASLDTREFHQESIKIQLAIQQAKSLTVLKSRSAMAEAKILLGNGEVAEVQELECFSPNEILGSEETSSYSEFIGKSHAYSAENQKLGGMGDLPGRRQKKDECSKESGNKFEEENSGSRTTRIEKSKSFLLKRKGETPDSRKESEPTDNAVTPEKTRQEMLIEISRKNETIAHLNSKIFELQKTCEEHVQLRNYLQNKLSEYHEKIQWNHVLWEQIGKLKGRIKEFQESHEKYEKEKRELEMKIASQSKEIERITKLNQLLNQRRFLLSDHESFRGLRGEVETMEGEKCLSGKFINKKILEEKQNSINVLKMVLNVMLDQENLAQKQIAMFQSKIEELERSSKIEKFCNV